MVPRVDAAGVIGVVNVKSLGVVAAPHASPVIALLRISRRFFATLDQTIVVRTLCPYDSPFASIPIRSGVRDSVTQQTVLRLLCSNLKWSFRKPPRNSFRQTSRETVRGILVNPRAVSVTAGSAKCGNQPR